MRAAGDLAATLDRVDGRGYKSYRDIEGAWQLGELELHVDRVQPDPFAAPSKLRVRIPLEVARLPDSAHASRTRRIASACCLAGIFRDALRDRPRPHGTGQSGVITIDAGGQEVLERSAVVWGDDFIEARIEVGLPAAGRRVLGREAARLLLEIVPDLAARAWIRRSRETDAELLHFVDCVENQEFVRAALAGRGLIAFVGDGAMLPRESGASELPMAARHVLPFESPDTFRVEIEVPHADAGAPGRIWRGMGVPRGIVLLVGGGYHGKSTLLRALERAVVPHRPGDGRETVVADPGLVKIRAEDGRPVTRVDVQGFIDGLPTPPGSDSPRETRDFSTADASGSTSQAANIVEAIEAGATGLLLDEDTSATNFMVRDALMRALIHPDHEPITPFLERVRELYERFGLSTVLVMGGSGEFFQVADAVIELTAYRALDVTDRAHEIAAVVGQTGPVADRPALRAPRVRAPLAASFDPRRGRQAVKISAHGCDEIVFGSTAIDLRGIEQLFDPSQTRAIAASLLLASQRFMSPDRELSRVLDDLERFFDEEGLDALDPFQREPRSTDAVRGTRHPGALARPRRFEIAAAINRLRTLQVRQLD